MDIKRWLAHGSMATAITAMAFMPAASMASTGPNPVKNQKTITATTPEARTLLDAVRRDAQQVARRTSSLENFANAPTVDRSMQNTQLKRIQAKVDDMDYRFRRLEAMESSLPMSDQRAIRDAKPLVRAMRNDTTAAMGDLSSSIPYTGYAKTLNEEAQAVARNISTGGHPASL
jgi:hypothetical protein